MALFDFLTGKKDTVPAFRETISPEGFEQPNTTRYTGGLNTADPGLELGLQSSLAEDASDRMKQYEDTSSSFMPKFIATMAALSGNFGPAFQLQEQSRKTALAKATFPTIVKINQLTNQGKFEEAQELAETTGNSAVSRAPELAPLYQDITKRISDRHNRTIQVQNLADFYKAQNEVYKSQHNGEDSPIIRATQNYLNSAAKRGQPVDPNLLQTMVRETQPHIQDINGRLTTTAPLAGVSTVQPMPQIAQASQFDTVTGNLVGASHDVTTNDIANLKNGISVRDSSGQIITANSPKAQQIIDDITKAQFYESDIIRNKSIPLDPEMTTMLLQSGVSADRIARRNWTRDEMTKAIGNLQAKRIELAEAPWLAQMEKDPFILDKNNRVAVVVDPNSGNFGQEVTDPQSWKMMEKNVPGTVKVIRREVNDKEIKPYLNTIQGLGYILDVFQASDNDKTLMDSLSKDVKDVISGVIGRPIGEGMTKVAAARAIVNNAIEQVENTSAFPREEIGRLKSMMTKPFTSPEQAIREAMDLQKRLKEKLSRTLGQQPVDKANIPGELKEEKLPKWMQRIKEDYDRVQQGQPSQLQKKSGLKPGSGR